MSYQFKIPVAALKAVALAKGVLDIRYYLNGVLLEAATDGVFLVATDGHRMHAMRVVPTYSDNAAPLRIGMQVIIPGETIDAIKITRASDAEIDFTIDDAGRTGQVAHGPATHSFTAIDGKFPDWRRVLPRSAKIDGVGSYFNPEYLIDVQKAAKLLGAKRMFDVPQVEYAGGTGGTRLLITSSPDFVATMMPFLHKKDGKQHILQAPSWAT